MKGSGIVESFGFDALELNSLKSSQHYTCSIK